MDIYLDANAVIIAGNAHVARIVRVVADQVRPNEPDGPFAAEDGMAVRGFLAADARPPSAPRSGSEGSGRDYSSANGRAITFALRGSRKSAGWIT